MNTTASLTLLEYSNMQPAVPLNATVSMWIVFQLHPEPHNTPSVEWCSAVTQLCDSGELSGVSNTYTANLTKEISQSDYGSYEVFVCGVALSLIFAVDYDGAGRLKRGYLQWETPHSGIIVIMLYQYFFLSMQQCKRPPICRLHYTTNCDC